MGPTWLGDELAKIVWYHQDERDITSNVTTKWREINLWTHDNEKNGWTGSLLNKYKCLWMFRLTAFVLRFVKHCFRQEKRSGSMTTQELKKAEDVWLEVAEKDGVMGSHMELKVDKVGLWGCSGRAPDYHPVFIPRKHLLATSIIERRC